MLMRCHLYVPLRRNLSAMIGFLRPLVAGAQAKEDDAQWKANPVLGVKKCKVSDYNGVSLSSLGSSQLVIGPPVPETAALQAWWASGGSSSSSTKSLSTRSSEHLAHTLRARTITQSHCAAALTAKDVHTEVARARFGHTVERSPPLSQLTVVRSRNCLFLSSSFSLFLFPSLSLAPSVLRLLETCWFAPGGQAAAAACATRRSRPASRWRPSKRRT